MISQSLVKYACQLAIDISANAVLIYADAANAIEDIRETLSQSQLRFIVASRDTKEWPSFADFQHASWVAVPDVPMTRLGQIRIALLVSLSRQIVKKGDRIVLLTGIDHSQQIDTIMVVDLQTESELISVSHSVILGEDIQSGVFDKVLALSTQIASEGREGRRVGCLFVIGDTKEVLSRAKSLVLNPFYGHPPEHRNILDPSLDDTIKEFSSIDGAFVVTGDGTVESAGIQLLETSIPQDLRKGLGTRHAAAAAITFATKALSVVVSQSTGNISVFKSGRMISEITRPAPV